MSLRARLANKQEGERFPETVAQWRLQLSTDIKNASALPTSMFHTRDALLEAMLAASTEAMLARLHMPAPEAGEAQPGGGAQRLEAVPADELRRLPAKMADDGPAPHLNDRAEIEALGVLVDAALGPDAVAAATASWLLGGRLRLAPDADVDVAAAQLRQLLVTGIAADPATVRAVDAVARRVVAAVVAKAAEEAQLP